MRGKLLHVLCSVTMLSFSILSLNTCHAESEKAGVCRSPHLEVTRDKWEGNNWIHLRDADSKTFEIEDITFNVSLDGKGISIEANGINLVYIDYSKYRSNIQDRSKSRRSHYTTSHSFQGRKVKVRILNFAVEETSKGGFRWGILEIYVESTKSFCEAVGGTFVGRFPDISPIEMDHK